MMGALDPEVLKPVLDAELARRELLPFATRVYPRFETPAHIGLIARLLEQIEAERLRRLQISVPVRHGKSVLASQIFPAWYLGRHPDRNVIIASHSEDLAVRNSRVAKHLVEDDRWPFGDVRLATDSQSAARWNIAKRGGGLYAVGIGGGITGRGADLLIIDDALHDGLSEVERESAYRWYSEVAVPRLEPGGAIVVIGARFAEDDLCGRIIESEDGPNWHVVNLPAIAEENDPLGRAPGEALWPERMDIPELEMRRVAMGSRAFEAQFQQHTSNPGGALFKTEWFDRRYEGGIPHGTITESYGEWPGVPGVPLEIVERPAPSHVIMAVDCASKTGISNDYSVLATIASDEVDFYVVDIVRDRLEFTDLIRAIIETHRKFGHSHVFVEDASAGIQIVQELRRWTNLPVIPVTPERSKIARAESLTGLFEAKRIRLPERAHWLEDFMYEFTRFPGRHDDIVDATILGVSQMDRIVASAQVVRERDELLQGWMAR